MELTVAFACGPPRDHKCDTDGPNIVFNDTEVLLESEARKRPDFPKGWTGGSVTCSKCGTSDYENSFWREDFG